VFAPDDINRPVAKAAPVPVPTFRATVYGVFLVHLTLMVLLAANPPAPGVYVPNGRAAAVAEHVDRTVAVTAKVVVVVVAEWAAPAVKAVAPKVAAAKAVRI
jgi:hypothetical protein